MFRKTVMFQLVSISIEFLACETCRAQDLEKTIRVGIIGLDTSHAIAFTKELNQTVTENGPALRVIAAYPFGSRDIESSASRIPAMTQEMQQLGVNVVDSVAELLKRVDCVLLETNDGNLHREQANEVFAAGVPMYPRGHSALAGPGRFESTQISMLSMALTQ